MTALRLLGAALVALAGLAFGKSCRDRLRACADALDSVCAALALLRAEITERFAPLPEIAARLGQEGPEACRGWFSALARAFDGEPETRFSVLWERTLSGSGLSLPPEARAAVERLGLCLGRYGALEQAAEIDRCLASLTLAQRRAADTAREQGRLCVGLGLAGGLLVAILLL